MPFTTKDVQELNDYGVELWFRKYADFLSCFRQNGSDGLRSKMASFYDTTGHGETELQILAANSMSEKEVVRAVKLNPDIDLPDYDAIYLAAVSRLASEALLTLMERGVLQEILLVDEVPELAQRQYDALVREARPQKQVAPAQVDLKQFAKDYHQTPTSDLRPKSGMVRVNGTEMPYSTFQSLFNKACAAGLVRG